ncbi:unnamed protein product [Cyprideis torosa]|uniref:RNA helicase n=1 Tax=Cyprideis torosa TaxID=163714 RepID=A0A7R8W7C8_9CRUS|nr:unnamed protein product [Cyprideis torosa]CAG0886170.1 unnamed protein product [Cyprideis torosa]
MAVFGRTDIGPQLERNMRHHVHELLMKDTYELIFRQPSGPHSFLFKRFQDRWDFLYKSSFSTINGDDPWMPGMSHKGPTIVEFLESVIRDGIHLRENYCELLKLSSHGTSCLSSSRSKVDYQAEKRGVHRLGRFVSLLYVNFWHEVSIPQWAPKNDLDILQSLRLFPDKDEGQRGRKLWLSKGWLKASSMKECLLLTDSSTTCWTPPVVLRGFPTSPSSLFGPCFIEENVVMSWEKKNRIVADISVPPAPFFIHGFDVPLDAKDGDSSGLSARVHDPAHIPSVEVGFPRYVPTVGQIDYKEPPSSELDTVKKKRDPLSSSVRMVYFEGIGLINEKPPIVIEIGRRYSRCGVSGDSFPYGLVPTRPSLFEDETRFHADRTSGQLQLSLIDFIQNELCAQTLLLSLKDRQIVIVESVLGSSDFREALAEVFFNHFEVASVLFCPSHSAALYPLGLTSALVVDIGFKETTIVPVIQGYVVLKAWQALPMATSALHKRLAEELSRCDVLKAESLEGEEEDKSVLKEKLTPSVLEDVQVRCCFITTRERKQKLESGEEIKFPPDVYYPLDGLTTLVIPGKVREFAGEALFECDEDGNTTNSSILRCILDSPIDARKDLLENILVIGGTAEMNGLKDRLMDELRKMLKFTFQLADPVDDKVVFQCLGKNWRSRLEAAGVASLFPLQVRIIQDILKPNCGLRRPDICVAAPTGTGKTLSYVIPILKTLEDKPVVPKKIRALIILPVRDLAIQVYKVFQKCLPDKSSGLYSHVPKVSLRIGEKSDSLSDPDVVIATPGKVIETLDDYQNVEFLVFDEADRLLQRRFVILLRGMGSSARPPLRILLSATLTEDPELFNSLELFVPHFFVFKSSPSLVSSADSIKPKNSVVAKEATSRPEKLNEFYIRVTQSDHKPLALLQIMSNHKKCLVFTNSVEASHRLFLLIRKMLQLQTNTAGHRVEEFSSRLNQKERQLVVKEFQEGKISMLIASDAMARGMDFPDVDCVISYDVPRRLKSYVHRVGRTARAGQEGSAYLISTASEQDCRLLNNICANSGSKKLEEVREDREMWKTYLEIYQDSLHALKLQVLAEEQEGIGQLKREKQASVMKKGKRRHGRKRKANE